MDHLVNDAAIRVDAHPLDRILGCSTCLAATATQAHNLFSISPECGKGRKCNRITPDTLFRGQKVSKGGHLFVTSQFPSRCQVLTDAPSVGPGLFDLLRDLEQHGIGPGAKAAVKAAVMTEDVARTVWIALQLGVPDEISAEDVAKLRHRYTSEYGQ